MFMMAKNFDEAKKMLNVAMAEKYPDTFSIAIFIDDGIKRGFCTENSIDEMQIKKTLTACYQSALDVLNDYSAESKNENSGIKLTINKEDSKLKVRDFILTDDEIKTFATDFVKYVKDVLSENYKSGKTHGDYHTGCHFGYSDMVDAATYGANAVYDLMMKKIMDSGACKKCECEKNPINECVKRATEKKTIDGVTAAFAKYNPNIKLDTYDEKSCFEFVFGDNYTSFARMITDIYAPTHSARMIFEENGLNKYLYSLYGERCPFIRTFLCLCRFFIECGKKANAYKSAIFTSQGLKAFNAMEYYFVSNRNDNLCEFCDTLDAFADFILK